MPRAAVATPGRTEWAGPVNWGAAPPSALSGAGDFDLSEPPLLEGAHGWPQGWRGKKGTRARSRSPTRAHGRRTTAARAHVLQSWASTLTTFTKR